MGLSPSHWCDFRHCISVLPSAFFLQSDQCAVLVPWWRPSNGEERLIPNFIVHRVCLADRVAMHRCTLPIRTPHVAGIAVAAVLSDEGSGISGSVFLLLLHVEKHRLHIWLYVWLIADASFTLCEMSLKDSLIQERHTLVGMDGDRVCYLQELGMVAVIGRDNAGKVHFATSKF